MKFHHTGCVVPSLEKAVAIYLEALGPVEVSPVFEIKSQGVRVQFLSLGSSQLELVEPQQKDSPLAKYADVGFYHIAFEVKDFDETVSRLRDQNHDLVTMFRSEAFQGRPCVFLKNPLGHLLELIAC